jgi:hypothetical protein
VKGGVFPCIEEGIMKRKLQIYLSSSRGSFPRQTTLLLGGLTGGEMKKWKECENGCNAERWK